MIESKKMLMVTRVVVCIDEPENSFEAGSRWAYSARIGRTGASGSALAVCGHFFGAICFSSSSAAGKWSASRAGGRIVYQ